MQEEKGRETLVEEKAAEQPTIERIIQISTGGWAFGVLATGVAHSVFTHIEKGADTLESIAERAGISERGAGALLDGLVGLGFLTVDGGRYRNSPDAAVFLVEEKPTYFGGFPRFIFDLFSDWLKLPEIVRTGRPIEAQADVPENPFWEKLVPAIAVLSAPVVEAAAERLRIRERGPIAILDVGGGSGVYSRMWLQMNPQARATQIDWANVNRLARGFLAGAGVADRFRTIDADFHSADFGNGEYDVAVYSHIAHQEPPASNVEIFGKLRKALKPGGTLVISDFVVEDDRSGPPFPLLFRNEMLVRTKEGSTWCKADYRHWLTQAGFRKIDFEPTPSPATLVYAGS